MKCNDRNLVLLSEGKADIEGRLNYRKINSANSSSLPAFKERWFKLINNFLFYFKINDFGAIDDKHAAGVLVLENSKIDVELDQETPFTFSISFLDESDKKHIFAARTQEIVQKWMKKLERASYEYMRIKLAALQAKIVKRTGQDPLLMVPRNEGSLNLTSGSGYSICSSQTKERCTSKTHKSSFHCHLEKQIHSSVTTKSSTSSTEVRVNGAFEGNSVFFNPFQSDGEEKLGVLYQRAAPSPPARKKHSPNLPRSSKNEVTAPVKPLRRHQHVIHSESNYIDTLNSGIAETSLSEVAQQEPPVGNLIEF